MTPLNHDFFIPQMSAAKREMEFFFYFEETGKINLMMEIFLQILINLFFISVELFPHLVFFSLSTYFF